MTETLKEEVKEMTGKDQSIVANTIFRWWQDLDKNPGGRAMLRRSKNMNQVAMLPIYYSLLNDIRKVDPDFKNTFALPLVAGVLSRVKVHFPDKKNAAVMGFEENGKKKVKDLRFRKLLRTEDLDDLYLLMIRLIHLMDDRANVYDLIRSLLNWREWTRRKWAEDYYTNTTKD
jgi:CRISPR system Cascade subunit CasB